MADITMSEAAVKALGAFYDDIMMIQSNARCSDRYFRNHVMTVIKGPQTQAAFKEAKAAAQKPQETPKRSKLAKYDE